MLLFAAYDCLSHALVIPWHLAECCHDLAKIQWRPIQIRAFHSNENGLFCTHPLSIDPLFWWKERGKQEALI